MDFLKLNKYVAITANALMATWYPNHGLLSKGFAFGQHEIRFVPLSKWGKTGVTAQKRAARKRRNRRQR
ncbi:hypothetical protein QEO94_11215 [Kingella negevensis]|uniref:hypothetical protein n=1 Tax=Kingella negevensis TaxID=1522312 RepID=UPI002543988F|nr:hypothetical protein [Kingella negevensis]WII93169.1 hypothetical protein QEO94_11215 [Kingella negevensis]